MTQRGPDKVKVTKEELEQAYVNDPKATMGSVGKLFGVDRATINRWLKHYGIPSKGRKHYKEVLDQRLTDKEWLREQMETKPQKQIAEELGVYGAVVSYWARKHGLDDKNKSEAVKRGLSKKYPDGVRGNQASNWKGGRHVQKTGYVLIHAPEHPHARNGRVFEHRLVMEKHLGRYLTPDEAVHHINGKRDDNRIENLEIKEKGKHISDHFKSGHEANKLRQRVAELEAEVTRLKAELDKLGQNAAP